MRLLSAITVLLYCFLETFGFPANLQCLGKRQGGQVHFNVSPNITDETRGCDTQWLVNKTVMAYWEGNGYTQFKFPILNLTANTAIMAVDSDDVKYTLDCPNININRKLLCSYPSLDPLPEQGMGKLTRLPDWWIVVAVIAGIVLLFVFVALLIHKLVRKKPRHYARTDENDAD